jgi:hypothetical protein
LLETCAATISVVRDNSSLDGDPLLIYLCSRGPTSIDISLLREQRNNDLLKMKRTF